MMTFVFEKTELHWTSMLIHFVDLHMLEKPDVVKLF